MLSSRLQSQRGLSYGRGPVAQMHRVRTSVRAEVSVSRIGTRVEEAEVSTSSSSLAPSSSAPSPSTSSQAQPLVLSQADFEARLAQEYARGFEEGQKSASPQADSMTRTAIKSFTWRVVSTVTTITLALVLFTDMAADQAVELGVMEFVSKYALYFAHERIWAALTFIV